MDQIAFILLLALGVPLGVGIWLIIRAVATRTQMDELARRLDELQSELARLKRQADDSHSEVLKLRQSMPQPAAAEEKTAAVAPAPLPARKEEVVAAASTAAAANQPAAKPLPESKIPPVAPPQPPAKPILPPIAEPVLRDPRVVSRRVVSRISEPAPAAPPPVLPRLATPPPPMPKPAPPAAEASAPPPISSSAPAAKDSFEMRVGKYWAVRIGVVVMLTSLAFGANLAYQDIVSKMGPAGKISLLYLASVLLLGAGAWWQRRQVKESLKNYAQVLFAGGLAAVYFTTYAAHYAPPVRVIVSPVLDGTLLLLWAGVIAWIADRRRSEIMALFAVGLAFFTSVITRVGEFTLYSNLILTVAAVVFLVRNRWAGLSFAGLVASYAGYAFWRFFQGDSWHWAQPGENLGLGALFLASYWVVFTAATFLSQSEKLSGPNRAAFLTLNNGAYFTLFLLTMLQVHTGGFWKFSLIYGTVLLALAAAARQFLPAEPLTKNSYLSHGLTLVTLGFISKFAGLHLALVLGAESVVLYVLATQRQSAVLKFFAYAAALLAVGWCAASLRAFDSEGLWTAAGLGVGLAFNAAWSYWLETKAGAEPRRLESSAFMALAFACWAMAAWFNTAEPHLLVALVFGVASAIYYHLIEGYKIAVPKFAAYASGIGAAIWCAAGFRQFDTPGLWIAVTVGAIMVLNALRICRASPDEQNLLRLEPSAWSVLAFVPWLAATWFNTTQAHLPLVLAAEAVALTFSIYLLRVREITLLGQIFLIFAQVAWLARYLSVTPPWWNPALLIAVTIGLSHWWQHQKEISISANVFTGASAVLALAAVGVALVWLHPLVSAPAWLVLTSLLAVAVTGYGLLTRAWMLAIGGQIFLGVSALGFLRALIYEKPEWYCPLAPLVVLAGLSFATIAWFARTPDAKAEVRQPLLQVAMVYRWLALAMSLLWIWDYVPERERVWACTLAAAAVFALAIWRSAREGIAAAAVYSVAALAALWIRDDLRMEIYLPNLLALLALFAMQQILRRTPAKLPLADNLHGAIVIIAGVSLWRYLSCWTAPHTSGIYITMTWAGFAVAAFTAGILLHERFLRWFGLGVLASAVGRVVIVDVWTQEMIYRVLTFLALGIALFVVGFIYNKYEEKIRQWL